MSRATIFGAALFSSLCFGINAQVSYAQSIGADIEAIDAAEAPLRVDRQGPICGKLELGATAPVPRKSGIRLQPIASDSEATVQQQATARRTEAMKTSVAEPAQAKRITQIGEEQGKLAPHAVQSRAKGEPAQEFNWLSDEPVSDTAAKFAADAKKELQAKVNKTTVSTAKEGKNIRRANTAASPVSKAPASSVAIDVTENDLETIASNKPVTEKSQPSFSESEPQTQVRMQAVTKDSSTDDSPSSPLFSPSKKGARVDPQPVKVAKKPHCSGVADYYADHFHGLKTASGQIHDREKYTAAHRTLPFGTKLKVVNRNTGKACIVTVNDRGPFTPSRVIDLSSAAAKELGLMTAKSRLVDCYIVENE